MSSAARRVARVRAFNRFYTKRIGVLQPRVVGSPFALTAARVLYELAQRERATARDLIAELDVDGGYLSRILSGFERDGLLRKKRSREDGRQRWITLTAKGRRAFDAIDRRSQEEMRAMLRGLAEPDQQRLVRAMRTIEQTLGRRTDSPITLRRHAPGDLGFVIHRHGMLYAREYGWDETFEALVAEILGKFLKRSSDERERSWIAEMDGEIVGCVFCERASARVAQLRCLLVEPAARGRGLGARLVDECIRFARRRDYRKMRLWTMHVLRDARRLYERAGFQLTSEEPGRYFGHELVAQEWEVKL